MTGCFYGVAWGRESFVLSYTTPRQLLDKIDEVTNMVGDVFDHSYQYPFSGPVSRFLYGGNDAVVLRLHYAKYMRSWLLKHNRASFQANTIILVCQLAGISIDLDPPSV